jgi:DNA-directed RNA polymerase subunit RPC12/RpoP
MDDVDESDLIASGYVIKPTGMGKIRCDGKPIEGPRYVCQMCGTAVSMYASSLYVHVKNHMNYKPYACSLCEYRTPVKSKARRHVLVGRQCLHERAHTTRI